MSNKVSVGDRAVGAGAVWCGVGTLEVALGEGWRLCNSLYAAFLSPWWIRQQYSFMRSNW